jgi:uncharacterized secreted protein with C-terminal beta-propeller domain
MGSDSGSGGVRPVLTVVAAGMIIAGCAASAAHSPVRPSPSLRLVAYDDCGQLLTGLRRAAAAHAGPYGLSGDPIMRPLVAGRVPGDATAAAPSVPHSGTNVQEPGVDEPDAVKTDGRRIVTVTGGRLRVVDTASGEETGSVDLRAGAAWTSGDLLMSGDRVLVVLRPAVTFAGGRVPGDVGGAPRDGVTDIVPGEQRPRFVLVDIKGAPRVVSTMTADGAYVDARQTGSTARIVLRSTPHITFPGRQGRPGEDATAANRAAIAKAPLDAWLPRYTVTGAGRTRNEKVPCDQVSHPPSYTGTSMVSVLSVDLNGDMSDVAPVSVVAGGQTVYGSADALYVTDRPAGVRTDRTDRTDIYRFDTNGPGRPRFAASGSVPGEPLNSYALSEYAGNLRIATTSSPPPGPPTATPPRTESAVYVLARHGGRLEQVGRAGGLGRGERVYAVRFTGPLGYVVTFRQTDPLYALDLRDPARPRVSGELRMEGYSAYLHPAGDGRLIGVGQEADGKGRPEGARVALFDVGDPAHPRQTGAYTVPSGWAATEGDPHAFLYRPDTGLTVVPLGGEDGALVLKVTASGVHRVGSVRPPATAGPVRRALLTGGTLWTLTATGLQANDATSLAKTAWVPFRP